MTDSTTDLLDFLLVSHGLYWRPDGKGYTGIKSEAGRYSTKDAEEHIARGYTAVLESIAPDYSDACWPETKLADKDKKITEQAALIRSLQEQLKGAELRGFRIAINEVGKILRRRLIQSKRMKELFADIDHLKHPAKRYCSQEKPNG